MPQTALVLLVASIIAASPILAVEPRDPVLAIRERGFLTCGVAVGVAGFAEVNAAGRYTGLDIDVCRALAAAVVGDAEKVRFIPVASAQAFLNDDAIDVVVRRLTWELQREAPLGLLFGPVTFFDGQAVLARKKLGARDPKRLAGVRLCVAGGTSFELHANKLAAKKVVLDSADAFDDIAAALSSGRCDAYTADVSELATIRLRLKSPADFEIINEEMTKEPLAPLVREADVRLFDIVRWTLFALIEAEELGVTSTNIATMQRSGDVDVQRLLGAIPGNGAALGLDEQWALRAVLAVGNYGEIFERNLGNKSALKLPRGRNRLWRDGGLMFAPPLR